MAKDPHRPTIVTSQTALREACERLAKAESFAFDTEFVGEDNYQPEICLVQAATDSYCVLIDPLADLDLTPFWNLIAAENLSVIVHAGAEDLALCWKHLSRPAANVFDLQIGAGLIGLSYPISLSRLAQQTIGAKLHKTQTLTDWRKRPLTDEQITYAVQDVAHLPAIHQHLIQRLGKLGRQEWAVEECARACRTALGAARGEHRIRRLRGARSLAPKELAIADSLLDERDRLAQEYNRPPRTVLRDHLLIEVARRGWTDPARLRTLRGVNLSAGALRRLGEAVARAKLIPPEQWPVVASDDDSPEEEVLLAVCTAVLRDYCRRQTLSYPLVAGKQDLRTIVRTYTRSEQAQLPILLKTGWRKAAIGDLLDQVLSGQVAVRVARERTRYGLLLG